MSTKTTREPKIRIKYTLSLTLWQLADDGGGDGETVASADISLDLFSDILSQADYSEVAPGVLLKEMATDGVKWDSTTLKRLEAA